MKSHRFCLLALVLSTALLVACSSKKPAGSCSGDEDCPDGQVCSAEGECVDSDASVDASPDARRDGSNDPCAYCRADEECLADRCIIRTPCENHDDCSDDTYCDDGWCIPWGTGPLGDWDEACILEVEVGLFSPVEQCSWRGPSEGDAYPEHRNVLATPMVVDFDFDGDDQTHEPSIVFPSYNGTDGLWHSTDCVDTEEGDPRFGVIRVIDGATCELQHTIDVTFNNRPANRMRASSPLAVGDLNGDGRPDVVGARCGGGLFAFSYDPETKQFELLWEAWHDPSAHWGAYSGPAIHDLDDDGKPEVLMWGLVWSHEGKLLDDSAGELPYNSGYFAVAADLDGDGLVELADGNRVWQWRDSGGTPRWVPWKDSEQERGQVALADFGTYGTDPLDDDRSKTDGVAELAICSEGSVRIQTVDGRVVFGPVQLPPSQEQGGSGGPPTAGDFDGDGRVEVALAGENSYSVFDPDCGSDQADECLTTEIRWTTISQDKSSSVTGSSLFDFDGDGAVEAVYADECFTRVYDGKTGEVIFSQWRSSCTWYDSPVIADVDGDFNSELVVSMNDNCSPPESDPDTNCRTNVNHDFHPVTGEALDPLFKGLRCEDALDCVGGGCVEGLCRCTTDRECGGNGFVCSPPKAGTAGEGNVCRAAYKGKLNGVRVYRDALDNWVSSRMIWNQHAYSVTNVTEAGLIPRTSERLQNWTTDGLNNFRQNVQGELAVPWAAPDATAQRTPFACDENGAQLIVKLCNRGGQPMGKDIPITFYLGSPADGKPICTARSEQAVDRGKCVVASCRWSDPPEDPEDAVDVYVVADDDGSGQGEHNECKEGNNATLIRGFYCDILH